MRIIDGDSHSVEPIDLFQKVVDKKFRDRAVRFKYNPEQGEESLILDGKEYPTLGIVSGMVGFGQPGEGKSYTELDPRRAFNPDWQDMSKRVQFCDDEGIDVQILYPTLALAWNALMEDPILLDAHCRGYNDWIFDLCGPYKSRLKPAAHISLTDPGLAVREIDRMAKLGCRTVCVLCFPPNGRSYGHPDFDPIWAAAEGHDMAVAIHIAAAPNYWGSEWYTDRQPEFYFVGINIMNGPRMGLTTMIVDGVFERFPKLRVASIESKSGWVGEWLERLDHYFYMKTEDSQMKRMPSEYFASNIWISGDPDEKMFPAVVKFAGDDNFFVGSDYPHSEGYVEPMKTARRELSAELPTASVDKILGANAAKFYGI